MYSGARKKEGQWYGLDPWLSTFKGLILPFYQGIIGVYEDEYPNPEAAGASRGNSESGYLYCSLP